MSNLRRKIVFNTFFREGESSKDCLNVPTRAVSHQTHLSLIDLSKKDAESSPLKRASDDNSNKNSVQNLDTEYFADLVRTDLFLFYIKPHSHPNGFYWGHQCSWTLTPANSMQVSIMQFDKSNRK